MKCISFNINSVRARPHQLIHLRDNLDPDVIGLQETKVDDPEFPMEEINEIGYHAEHWGGKVIMVLHYLANKNLFLSKKVFQVMQRMNKKDSYTALTK